MRWEVEFYKSASGRKPAADFIVSLQPKEQAKIARAIDLLEEFGPQIGMPYVKHLGDGLWELRVPFGGQTFRLLFFIEGNTLIMVHALSKKTPKTPLKELNTAIARMKDYKRRTGDNK
ncbi:type II toxin-antitoxin system RelE/ParE family toxin [Desulfofundulus sp. TPOSR]|uniref:type II toxin-antitoxin system RelE/ParE family toxin n=1 Tax=Desulfofundulus sp. TPOSR TaxID=2714340 RepID=UPI00140B4BB6|nr:type II toxin-antitoxin system RelE/ParE family toxin [Desulfofundulus sp. TPOSR]NHM27783.1 type II toxin-antitoxin system RelE/ParE family toxin [Desulfofundulus sp. TPOSR]